MTKRDSAPPNPSHRSNSKEHAAEWSEHEHSSPPVEMQAAKLLREAGSPDLAKHAVDAAAKTVANEGNARDQLARRLGFDSYPELTAASTSLVIPGDDRWWVTPQESGTWTAWNSEGVVVGRNFGSLEDARRHVVAGG